MAAPATPCGRTCSQLGIWLRDVPAKSARRIRTKRACVPTSPSGDLPFVSSDTHPYPRPSPSSHVCASGDTQRQGPRRSAIKTRLLRLSTPQNRQRRKTSRNCTFGTPVLSGLRIGLAQTR
eukprot:scaffold3368_cov194-Pinguiococcus_pyrenoidosus.AAC.2